MNETEISEVAVIIGRLAAVGVVVSVTNGRVIFDGAPPRDLFGETACETIAGRAAATAEALARGSAFAERVARERAAGAEAQRHGRKARASRAKKSPEVRE